MDPLINLTFLKSFTANDPAKIRKYATMFLTLAPQSMESMKSQLAAADWKALRTTAHSLKSQVKYMGIARAEELAIAIEKSAGDETNLEQLPATVEELNAIVASASVELQAELDKL